MAFEALLLILGMVLLVVGGRGLVVGASELGRALHVSETVIGLTVVAFGTSAPELAVNALAAAEGSASLAFGNVIGSNLANIGLVLGLCALMRPLSIESAIVSREIPMMLLATAATAVLGLDRIRGEREGFDRSDGVVLLFLFSIFLYYSIAEVIAKRRSDPLATAAAEQAAPSPLRAAGSASVIAIVGIVLLLIGAELTVDNAVRLADAMEVPSAVVGLTIVAVGTSLPELSTSLIATWHGHTNLAVANVVGSNIFNLLFILGTTSVIEPVPLPAEGGAIDLAALIVATLILLPLSRLKMACIVRWQGAVMTLAYLAYMVWRFDP